MKAVTSLLLLGLSLLPQLLWAQEWVDGTIRRIDTSGQKMTIKHDASYDHGLPPQRPNVDCSVQGRRSHSIPSGRLG